MGAEAGAGCEKDSQDTAVEAGRIAPNHSFLVLSASEHCPPQASTMTGGGLNPSLFLLLSLSLAGFIRAAAS
jgi:hypothetical protein